MEDLSTSASPTAVPGGAALARNAFLNFAGLGVPLLAAVIAVPLLVRALGVTRFGLLGLAWASLEYLALLDAGLTRATTQSVATAISRGTRDIRQVVSVSLALLFGVGVVFGGIFAVTAPWLAILLRVPPELHAEAVALFRVVGISVPVVLLMTSMRGVLEGAHRFDLSVATKIPGSLAAVLIPAACAYAGFSLPAMMLIVLAARVVICAVLWRILPRAIPGFAWEVPREWVRLRTIGRFAAWVGVSSVISPILVYLDRFFLAAFASVTAAGYYVGPYEGVTRLLVVPVSLSGVLFPALASMAARGESDVARAGRVVGRAVRQVFLAVLPAVAVAAVFAPLILTVWLGKDYATYSTTALRILAVGVLANALAHVPFAYIQAIGRPDLTARLHIVELIIHVPLTWWLVKRFGISGAAMAWTFRVTLDALLLAIVSAWLRHKGGHRPQMITRRGAYAVAFGALLVLALISTLRVAGARPAFALALASLYVATFVALAWLIALDDAERSAILRLTRLQRAS